MFTQAKELLRKKWWGLLAAYLFIVASSYLLIWQFAEPLGIPDNIEEFPSFTRSRVFIHVVLTLLISPYITLVLHFLVRKEPPSLEEMKHAGVSIFNSDYDAQNLLDGLTNSGKVRFVDILSAGLASRYSLITKMAMRNIKVRVIVQHSSAAIDKDDNSRLPLVIRKIYDQMDGSLHNNITIHYCKNTASIRSIIFYDNNKECVGALIGWYTYQDGNKAIVADPWPVFWATPNTDYGRLLIHFAQLQFDKNLGDCQETLS